MIGRALLIWSSAIVIAVNVPTIIGLPKKQEPTAAMQAHVTDASAPVERSYVVKANAEGHFEGRFRLNGKPIAAIVDTGATFVTLNETAARNLGYGGNELRFRYDVTTANGKVKAARITLKSVEIGTVQVRNVDALVIRDKSLKATLIGMSFMKKLGSYRADNDELKLIN
ncbi:TIGR02281 family clan AA aspartic protease [Rhizobium alvei]|uniref:TIGR02281 family clan AA aspartic protease n=1 Tax=Rhizobium alvei TaxID=1132659 RepID=A0ABT8YR63_9HYPH|nr:TIGR02281 family clan AA aspartic protease [Rhizobium alvei]MDO6966200.1 TIGR02281 family clan AA aspartic protease [Rhizobium alvei]